VVEVLTHAVEGSAVERGGIAGLRKVHAGPCEPVDHHVIADRVADPVRRRRRRFIEGEFLTAWSRIGVGGPDGRRVRVAQVGANPVAGDLTWCCGRQRASPEIGPACFGELLHRLAVDFNRQPFHIEIRAYLRDE